jgi:hypothetical protein
MDLIPSRLLARRRRIAAWTLGGAFVVALLALAPPARAADNMMAALAGSSEVPSVMGPGTGKVDIALNPAGTMLTWTVTYSGLSGPVTAAHFHGPAVVGQNGAVIAPITGPLASPIMGSTPITLAQLDQIRAGQWYINLHTAAHPNGEVRGQVVARP